MIFLGAGIGFFAGVLLMYCIVAPYGGVGAITGVQPIRRAGFAPEGNALCAHRCVGPRHITGSPLFAGGIRSMAESTPFTTQFPALARPVELFINRPDWTQRSRITEPGS